MKTIKKSLCTAVMAFALMFSLNLNLHAQNKGSAIKSINAMIDSGTVTKIRLKSMFWRMIMQSDSLKLRGDTTRLAIKTNGTSVGIGGPASAQHYLQVGTTTATSSAGATMRLGASGGIVSGIQLDASNNNAKQATILNYDGSLQLGIGTNLLILDGTAKTAKVYRNGLILDPITAAQKAALTGVAAGTVIFCSDCTATDSSTGVQQTYNGSAWKNAW